MNLITIFGNMIGARTKTIWRSIVYFFTKNRRATGTHWFFFLFIIFLLSLVFMVFSISLDDALEASAVSPTRISLSVNNDMRQGRPVEKSIDGVADKSTLKSSTNKAVENQSLELAKNMLAGTPMAGTEENLLKTAFEWDVNYTLIIGIAEAESNRGKSYVYPQDKNCFNAWGIKPIGGRRTDGSYLMCYSNWSEGYEKIASLLSRVYSHQTPEQMVKKYVGHASINWIKNVRKFYRE